MLYAALFVGHENNNINPKGKWTINKGQLVYKSADITKTSAGRVLDSLMGAVSGAVSLLDIYPALVFLLKLPQKNHIDEHDLTPLVSSTKANWDHLAWSHGAIRTLLYIQIVIFNTELAMKNFMITLMIR